MKKVQVFSLTVGLIGSIIVLPVFVSSYRQLDRLNMQIADNGSRLDAMADALIAADAATRHHNDVAGPGIAEPTLAKNPEPEKVAPAPTSQETPAIDLGGAPSCADLSHLRQAVNPTPRGTPYTGQLLIANGTGVRPKPCTRAPAFGNTGSFSAGVLQPGKYQLPYGTLTVHSQR